MLKFLTRTPDAEELQWRQRAHTLFRWALAIVAPLYLLFWLVPAVIPAVRDVLYTDATYGWVIFPAMILRGLALFLALYTLPYVALAIANRTQTSARTSAVTLIAALSFAVLFVVSLPVANQLGALVDMFD